MWTFWGFNVLAVFTGFFIALRYKISFAFLNIIAVALPIVFLINSTESLHNNTIQIIAVIIFVFVVILYVFTVIMFLKKILETHKIRDF